MNIICWTLLARLKLITVELYLWGLSEYLGTTSLKTLVRSLVQRLCFSDCLHVCLWLCGCFSCTVSRNAWEWDLFVIWVSQGFSTPLWCTWLSRTKEFCGRVRQVEIVWSYMLMYYTLCGVSSCHPRFWRRGCDLVSHPRRLAQSHPLWWNISDNGG